MESITKLPDTEFEIMKVIWASTPPINTNTVMEGIGCERNWKAPTAISLLLRLVDRGFLRTEKIGKERVYYPLVSKDDYLKFETGNFMRLYHEDSIASFVNTLSGRSKLSESDLYELSKLIEKGRE